MNKISAVYPMFLALALSMLTGCAGTSNIPVSNPAPLNASNLNLIFVVSPDLTYQGRGDVNPNTANLTSQGLQRSLRMAPFLQQQVLGKQNVTSIYALAPMTHPQGAGNLPDMAALETIQQFALQNQITLSSDLVGGHPYTGYNYPIYASYAPGSVPSGVAVPSQYCPTCQGLDFNDEGGDNETLVSGLLKANAPGFYVFSAPWETTHALLTNTNALEGANLVIPAKYEGPNVIYAISITTSGSASLATFNSNVNPPSTFPVLPMPLSTTNACASYTPSSIQVTGGVNGAVIPAGVNTNETLYIVRHVDEHPQGYWSDNNYVGAGQWRALALADALRGKINPDQVWSADPSQSSIGTVSTAGDYNWSGVGPALSVEPYAIANNLPYSLVSNFLGSDPNSAQLTSNFFFSGGKFSDHKALLGWMYAQNTQTLNALLASYFPNGGAPTAPNWSPTDYDSLWIVTLDASGNLTADFSKCEGINSADLPAAPPQF